MGVGEIQRSEEMNKSERREFEALSTEERAKWLLRKGVTAKLTMFPQEDKTSWVAYAAGIMLPGEYDTKEEAIAKGTEFLSEKAGFTEKK